MRAPQYSPPSNPPHHSHPYELAEAGYDKERHLKSVGAECEVAEEPAKALAPRQLGCLWGKVPEPHPREDKGAQYVEDEAHLAALNGPAG